MTAAGSVAVGPAGERLAGLRIARVNATPTRQQYCANGMREIGNYEIQTRGAAGVETAARGPYVVRWVVDEDDVARIDRLLLYGSATLSLTDVPCSPLVASRFGRAVLFVTPWTSATFSQTQSEMTKGGQSIGWTADAGVAPTPPASGSAVGGSAALATALVGVRVRVRSHWLEVATQVGNNASEQRLFHPDYRSLVSQTARASQTYALASMEFRRLRFGAGPTLLVTDWTSSETLFDRTLPPDVLPERTERTHTTRAIGGLLQGSFAIDLLFDNVLETIVQFRVVPAVHTGSLTIFPGSMVRQNALMIGASLGHAF